MKKWLLVFDLDDTLWRVYTEEGEYITAGECEPPYTPLANGKIIKGVYYSYRPLTEETKKWLEIGGGTGIWGWEEGEEEEWEEEREGEFEAWKNEERRFHGLKKKLKKPKRVLWKEERKSCYMLIDPIASKFLREAKREGHKIAIITHNPRFVLEAVKSAGIPYDYAEAGFEGKGRMLEKVLERVEGEIEGALVFDDVDTNVDSMVEALLERGIPAYGFEVPRRGERTLFFKRVYDLWKGGHLDGTRSRKSR